MAGYKTGKILIDKFYAEVVGVTHGLDADKDATPVVGDVYVASDTNKFYICSADGIWTTVLAPVAKNGTGTLSAGNQSKTITHGFTVSGVDTEPDWIFITPLASLGSWHITAKTSTTFTVKFSVSPDGDTNFMWRAGT